MTNPINHSNGEINFEAFDHIKFWVGNAKQASSFYCNYLGFEPYAYKGLESGSRYISSHAIKNNNAVFVFESALIPSSGFEGASPAETAYVREMSDFLDKRGDAIVDIAFIVDDAKQCFETACNRGAVPISPPTNMECRFGSGTAVSATISVGSGTKHTFIQRSGFKPTGTVAFLPGFIAS
ncbi:4-hydroxyphenylpyruvate dioxygenase, partial [Smittium mucronatum]